MGKKSRDKGIRGELEAARFLRSVLGLGYLPERILDQTRGEENGLDFIVWDWGIQVKRYATVTPAVVKQGLEEAEKSVEADKELEWAMVMHRGDRRHWKVTMKLSEFLAFVDTYSELKVPKGQLITMDVAAWGSVASAMKWQG